MSGLVRLCPDDAAFPRAVLRARPQPQVLYAEGERSLLERPMVAIVGSRTPSAYGVRVAYEAARALAEAGVVVVSGLARGLDARAHRGALDAGGGTIAVLGCGPDVAYPEENRALLGEIRHKGLVLSEHPPGTEPRPFRFPARNRIIAALGQCLLVVEGKPHGGTSNTVDWAQQCDRRVFAVPGRIGEPEALGPNLLIQQGAHLYLEPADILQSLGVRVSRQRPAAAHERAERARAELSGAEAALYDLIGTDPVHVDVLADRAALEPGLLLAALSSLELQGLVTQLPGKHFALAS
jgi:DNA processing protein